MKWGCQWGVVMVGKVLAFWGIKTSGCLEVRHLPLGGRGWRSPQTKAPCGLASHPERYQGVPGLGGTQTEWSAQENTHTLACAQGPGPRGPVHSHQ